MVKSGGNSQVLWREKTVLFVSSLFVLWRVCLTSANEENAYNSTILSVLTFTTIVLSEPDIPSSLSRDGSSGLFYGLVLVPAVLIEITEQIPTNSDLHNTMQLVANEQVTVSVWLAMFFYSTRLRFKSTAAGQSMQSFFLFLLSGFVLQSVFKLDVTSTVLMHVISSLLVAKLSSSHLPKCFTCGELFLCTRFLMCFLLSYPYLSSNIEVCVVTNYTMVFVSFFLFTLIPLTMAGLMSAWLFYSSGAILLLCLLSKLSESLLRGFLIWVYEFFQSNWPYRLELLTLWSVEILVCILYVTVCRPLSQKSNTTERKIFHIVIIMTFVPGIYLDMPMIFVCSVGATCLLLLLEAMRTLKIPPLAEIVNERFKVFLDCQDQGSLILTPIYLLLGQSLPIWATLLQQPRLLYELSSKIPLVIFSGILSVGVGDTAASFIGSKFGKTKWAGSNKTVEGTIAAIVSQLVFAATLSDTSISLKLISAVVSVSLIEAYTPHIDNLILPIYMYFLLNTS